MNLSAMEQEGFYIEGLQSLSLSTPLVDYYEEDSIRFCINWGGQPVLWSSFALILAPGMLEPVELPSDTTLLEVSRTSVTSGDDADGGGASL
eukprot:760046-Hanusia_phi.AAC.3